MTDHEKIYELISEKLDGVISADDDMLLADHLADCPKCRETFDILSGVREALDIETDAPDTLLPSVMEAVRAEKRRRKNRVRRFSEAAGILAAAAVLAFVIIPAATGALFGGKSFGSDNRAPEANDGSYGAGDSSEEPDNDFSSNEGGNDISSPSDSDPDMYESVEDRCADYYAVAWFDSLPDEIVNGAEMFRFRDGSVGYPLTSDQFKELMASAVKITYPDPDGTQIMAVIKEG